MKIRTISKLLFIFLMCIFAQIYTISYALEENNPQDVQLSDKNLSKLVGKINFDDVMKTAKEHSYDLQIADYNILISKQEVRGARSEYFPKLNLGAGFEYTKNFRDVSDTTVMSIGDAFINPYTRFQSILGITVAYNLFDFGVRGGNLKIAKEDVELKSLESKQKLQELNLTLLDTYTKILVTSKQIEINKQILSLDEKNLEMKERLFKAKEISKTELNDAKVKVKTTQNKISELYSIKQESLNWLSFYTGEEYDINSLKISDLKKPNFDILEFQDYTKSIVWKVHEKNIKKKELELTVAKRNYLPKVNAYGRYYLYGSDHSNMGRSFGIEPSNFSVGASLNMPIFDGFKNSANVQKTALELKQLQVERDKAIAELMTRLATMRSNLIYLDEQIEGNNKMISELTDKEKSLNKLASKRVVSPIEVNDAKIELLNQKIELEKNSITYIALTRGIQILTEEN
ncbi:TolC family protein [bacterium]|nr:TolC family protein [bacterium]